MNPESPRCYSAASLAMVRLMNTLAFVLNRPLVAAKAQREGISKMPAMLDASVCVLTEPSSGAIAKIATAFNDPGVSKLLMSKLLLLLLLLLLLPLLLLVRQLPPFILPI